MERHQELALEVDDLFVDILRGLGSDLLNLLLPLRPHHDRGISAVDLEGQRRRQELDFDSIERGSIGSSGWEEGFMSTRERKTGEGGEELGFWGSIALGGRDARWRRDGDGDGDNGQMTDGDREEGWMETKKETTMATTAASLGFASGNQGNGKFESAALFQIIALLLASGVGAGFAVTFEFKKLIRDFIASLESLGVPRLEESESKIDKFLDRANIAVGLLLLASLLMAAQSIVSSLIRSAPNSGKGFFFG
ncbi:hypothetical protein ACLOJK_006781 [Asimina triloba]